MPGFAQPLTLEFPDRPGNQVETVELREAVAYVRIAYAPIDFTIYTEHGTSSIAHKVRAGDRADIELANPVAQLTYAWDTAPAVPGADYAKAILIVAAQSMAFTGGIGSAVHLAQWDSLGQIRGWYPLASSESITNRLTGAALVDIVTNPVPVIPQRLATFDVVPRRTARDYSTNVAFGGAGRTQLVTLWAGANPFELISVDVALMEATAAVECWIDLIRLSTATQPAGGSNYTPVSRSGADTATTEVRRVPATPGVETGDAITSAVYKLGITGAVSTVNPAPPVAFQRIYELAPWNAEAVRCSSGGLAIVADVNAAATVRFAFRLTFGEDIV